MSRRRAFVAAALGTVCAVALVAGGEATPSAQLPDGPPDVSGTVATGPTLVDATDTYYEGMGLLRGEPLIVRESDGAVVPDAELEVAARVDVWIGGPCAESYPVQCEIEAVRIQP